YGTFARVNPLQKHVVPFRVVVSPVTDRESSPREFPGRLVVTVIRSMCLAEYRNCRSRLGQVLAALIKRFSLSDLVGRHLRVGATSAGRTVRRPVIARDSTDNERDERRYDHRRTQHFLLFPRIYH